MVRKHGILFGICSAPAGSCPLSSLDYFYLYFDEYFSNFSLCLLSSWTPKTLFSLFIYQRLKERGREENFLDVRKCTLKRLPANDKLFPETAVPD